MSEYLNRCLEAKFSLTKRVTVTLADIIAVAFLTVFALTARLSLFDYETGDYKSFLAPWYDALKQAGGLSGIGLSIGDYTPAYLYILALLTHLPIRDLYAIKLVSVLFDLVLAGTVMCIVYHLRQSRSAAIAAYGILLFLPTVLTNGAFWGQCDSIFVSFLLLCVCFFLKKRPVAAMICFGVAFSFKLQAVFLLPFLLVMWIKGRTKLLHFLLIPGVYLASVLPAFFMGRPLKELLTIYFSQTRRYRRLSLNAPNLYYFIYEDQSKTLSTAAILLCAAAVCLCLYLVYQRRERLRDSTLVGIALFFALLMPYLLPHMHERYFYTADILALIYGFCRPKRFYLPVLVVFASTASYLPFLFGHAPISLRLAALVMTAALLLVGWDLYTSWVKAGPPGEGATV